MTTTAPNIETYVARLHVELVQAHCVHVRGSAGVRGKAKVSRRVSVWDLDGAAKMYERDIEPHFGKSLGAVNVCIVPQVFSNEEFSGKR
jgi:hypothetical protein